MNSLAKPIWGMLKMERKKKAIIYARQSSGDDDVSASVEMQVEKCLKLARERGLQVDPENDVFRDLNISGKFYPDTEDARLFSRKDWALKRWLESTSINQLQYRSGLGEALSRLDGIQYLLLDDYTRLMRPLPQSHLENYIAGLLVEHNIQIICVKDGEVNLNKPEHILPIKILSMINAGQLEYQRQKSRDALRKLRDEGKRPSGSNFRGYRRIGKHKYEIVPEEAALVREAFELGIGNCSYMSICRTLTAKYAIKDLFYDTLMLIYKRPEYAGYQYNSNGELIESLCFKDIPIITLGTFLKMRERLKSKRPKNHDRKNIYAFTGLCYCGYCGERMQISSCGPAYCSKEQGHRLPYFTCTRNVYREHRKDCGSSHLRYEYFNQNEVNLDRDYLITSPARLKHPVIPKKLHLLGMHESLMALIIQPLIEDYKLLSKPKDTKAEEEKLLVRENALMVKKQKITEMFTRESLDEEQFEVLSKQLKNNLEAIREERLKLKAQISQNPEKIKREIKELIYIWQLKLISHRLHKAYAQRFIRRIDIFSHSITIHLTNGKNIVLERIPVRASRVLPDWSAQMTGRKAFIKYYYKSFYTGDTREQVIYDDPSMNIVTVGCNPPPRAWEQSRNHEWNWREQEIPAKKVLPDDSGQNTETLEKTP